MSTNLKPRQMCRDVRTGIIYQIRDISEDGSRVGLREKNLHNWTIILAKHLERIKHHTLTFEEITGFRSDLDHILTRSWFNNTTGQRYQSPDIVVDDVENEDEEEF